MKNELIRILDTLDEADFIELRHALHIASLAKESLKRYAKTEKEFADMLGASGEAMKAILSGSYPFDLKTMSKLDAVRSTLEAEKATKEMDELIKFPKYKDSEKQIQSTP